MIDIATASAMKRAAVSPWIWCPPPLPSLNKPTVLPIFAREEGLESAYPATEVTKIALKLKYQIEQIIPCELEEWKITKANSPIITQKVAKTAKEAGGEKYPSCVIFCLLICKRWFKLQANLELWDAEMHQGRAVACEVLAKRLSECPAYKLVQKFD